MHSSFCCCVIPHWLWNQLYHCVKVWSIITCLMSTTNMAVHDNHGKLQDMPSLTSSKKSRLKMWPQFVENNSLVLSSNSRIRKCPLSWKYSCYHDHHKLHKVSYFVDDNLAIIMSSMWLTISTVLRASQSDLTFLRACYLMISQCWNDNPPFTIKKP